MSTIQPGSLNRRSNRDTTPLKIHAFQSAEPRHFDSSSHGFWAGRENRPDHAIHVRLLKIIETLMVVGPGMRHESGGRRSARRCESITAIGEKGRVADGAGVAKAMPGSKNVHTYPDFLAIRPDHLGPTIRDAQGLWDDDYPSARADLRRTRVGPRKYWGGRRVRSLWAIYGRKGHALPSNQFLNDGHRLIGLTVGCAGCHQTETKSDLRYLHRCELVPRKVRTDQLRCRSWLQRSIAIARRSHQP
jgi:hypothetical protein